MKNQQKKRRTLDDVTTRETPFHNSEALSKGELRSKFLKRAVAKHEGLLIRLSRT